MISIRNIKMHPACDLGGGRTQTIYRKNLELFGDYRVGFTARFAKAVKDPSHILGKFFREVDFSANQDTMHVLKDHTPLLKNFLQVVFVDFIGITTEAQELAMEVATAEAAAAHKVNEQGTEVRIVPPVRDLDIIYGTPEQLKFIKVRVHVGERPIIEMPGELIEKYKGNLPPGYQSAKSRLEEILRGIPEEHRSIQICADEKGHRIVLDFYTEEKIGRFISVYGSERK